MKRSRWLGLIAAGLGAGAGLRLETASAAGSQLVFARVKDAVDLDPAVATDGLSLNVTSLILRGLVVFKPGTFDVIPAVAQSWKASADGKTWTFLLRPNLRFSDGTPVDAEAVKFNFDRWRLTDNPYRGNFQFSYYESQFSGFPGVIADVRTNGSRQVTFQLTHPMGMLLRNLAMPSFALGSPAAIKADIVGFDHKPVGNGPYLLQEWIRDDHITLTANPRWSPAPAYATVIVRDIPDQATSVLEIEKGDIDGLSDLRPDDARGLQRRTGITVYRQPSNNNSYLAMNMDKKPFEDVRVRRAIAYALDVQAIVQAFYGQGGVIANEWNPPGMLGHNPALKAYPRDVGRAKALLAQAGLRAGFSTQLYFGTAPRPYMPEPQRIAEAIQADLKAVGINVTLAPFEWGVFLQKIKNGEHPMCLIGWTGDNGDPDNFLYPLLDKDSAVKGGQNYSFWRDEGFHRLMVAGQSTVDERKRGEIYAKAQALVHDQVPAIPLVHTTVPFAMKSNIAGVIPRPDSALNFELMRPNR
ncbi:MAG: ABC transporter substrate-binding protein [Candidatus Eremiobacteraeota bacterium]|nr:ABC transporter substrate-binding protein [Candidatus Eremiobacteraeota bacterium]